MYQPRTPVENPYCRMQLSSDPPVAERMTWDALLGYCPDCHRLVNLRKNGTAKLHRMYGRGEMARRVAEYKRNGL